MSLRWSLLLLGLSATALADEWCQDAYGEYYRCHNGLSNAARIGIGIGIAVLAIVVATAVRIQRKRRFEANAKLIAMQQSNMPPQGQGQPYYSNPYGAGQWNDGPGGTGYQSTVNNAAHYPPPPQPSYQPGVYTPPPGPPPGMQAPASKDAAPPPQYTRTEYAPPPGPPPA